MLDSVEIHRQVKLAADRIAGDVRETYLEFSPLYSQLTGANVYFKCENLQHTGSFKLRGITNKYHSLSDSQKARGVVTASTGNHGKALAYLLKKYGGIGKIFVPENSDPSKVAAIRSLGGDVCVTGTDCVEAEFAAREYAQQHQATYISPYNDPLVVAGQGTIGYELHRQLPELDAVFVSVGGGGLIAGISGYLKTLLPDCKIYGGSPANSQVMVQSIQAGKILALPSDDTLSDGTAGGVEQDTVTFAQCQHGVDEWFTVSEEEIQLRLCHFIQNQGQLIEGAAAVATAGLIQHQRSLQGKNVVVILCGANIGLANLSRVINDSTLCEEI